MLRFDIHGIIVDVYNESKKLRNYLGEQLDYFLSEIDEESDIRIDFVSHLATPSKLKSIGNLASFGNNKFFIRLHTSRVLLPLHNMGRKIDIKSEVSVPLNKILESIIEPAVYFRLLTKNFVFIHSLAVFFNKTGIIFPAWTHAGKTELLFEFMKKDAHFMSDDWTFVSDSGKIYAYPRPIQIHPHTFRYLSKNSAKFDTNNFVLRIKKLSWKSFISSSEQTRSISIYDAFPNALIRKECNLDIIIHLLRYRGEKILVVEEDPNVIIEKTLSITKYARLHYFLPFYALYKFAFPKKRNPIIETAEEVERKILKKAFRGKPVYSLKIPLIANSRDVCDFLIETIF